MLFIYFILQVSTSAFPSLNTHERLLHLWHVAWLFPSSVCSICILLYHDILNQELLVPSRCQQPMPKIFIITLLSMREHFKPQRRNFQALFFSLLHIIQQKECKTKGDLLENNAMGKCCKTCESPFVKVVKFSTALEIPSLRPAPLSFSFLKRFSSGMFLQSLITLKGRLFTHLEVSNTLSREPGNETWSWRLPQTWPLYVNTLVKTNVVLVVGPGQWQAREAFFSKEEQLKNKFNKWGLSFPNIESAEPATISKFLIREFILQSECWDLVANWQDARKCHGREERAFSGIFGYLTSICHHLLEEETQSLLIGGWRGDGYQRWKSGVSEGTAICGFFFYCLKNRGLIIFPPFFADSGETVNKGLWRRARVVCILACEYVSSAPLSLVSARCLTKRAKCHTCHWKLTSAIAMVCCTQKRCYAQTTPRLSLLSFCFTCPALLYTDWIHIFKNVFI